MNKQMQVMTEMLQGYESDECLIWPYSTRGTGYGQVSIGRGKADYAHRVAYRLSKGEIPEGKLVMHSCDVKKCINPRHLLAGTNDENIRDAKMKGGMTGPLHPPVGEASGRAVLSQWKVMRIRKQHAQGVSERKLAARFNVGRTTIQKVVKGETWKHLPMAPLQQ